MLIVTHNGHFHADELLAVAALTLAYPESELIRTRDKDLISTADIVVDVGHIYDPAKGRFDHHQPEGAGKRENGIPYASFGLVWKEYGEKLCGGIDEAKVVDNKLVASIDALDNGMSIATPTVHNVREYTLGDYFESYAHGVNTLEDLDRAFREVLPQARELLKRKIAESKNKVVEYREVKKIYTESQNKQIIVLPQALSWKEALTKTEAMFVVFPRADGTWCVQGVTVDPDDRFTRKKYFPTQWSGLNGEALAQVSTVEDAIFCHRDRFIAGSKSKEGVLKMAEIALNY